MKIVFRPGSALCEIFAKRAFTSLCCFNVQKRLSLFDFVKKKKKHKDLSLITAFLRRSAVAISSFFFF